MRLIWSTPAILALIDIREYIARDNPIAADAVAKRIREAAEQLLLFPGMGRPGQRSGMRELVVRNISFLLQYRVREDAVEIIEVFHGARQPRA